VRVFPDGCADLVWSRSGGLRIAGPDTGPVVYGPKKLDRIIRFRRFLHQAGSRREASLAETAFEVGYADQAHLTRECRRLSGLTPGDLLGA
jgi:hypothetical protein